jgi:hypothetical protein
MTAAGNTNEQESIQLTSSLRWFVFCFTSKVLKKCFLAKEKNTQIARIVSG